MRECAQQLNFNLLLISNYLMRGLVSRDTSLAISDSYFLLNIDSVNELHCCHPNQDDNDEEQKRAVEEQPRRKQQKDNKQNNWNKIIWKVQDQHKKLKAPRSV